MQKLIALLVSLMLLTPAFALAEQGSSTTSGPGPFGKMRAEVELQHNLKLKAEANVGVHASTTNRGPGQNSGPGKLGPMIKNVASSTRQEIKGMASSTREMIRHKLDAMHDLIAQHRDMMQKRAEGAREKAKEHFGERVEKLVGKVSDRLASTSANLGRIADRIDARITVLEDRGFDMSSSTGLLAKAQSDLNLANDKITAVNAALDAAMSTGTTTAKAEIPAVRSAVKAAEQALLQVKKDLMETLRAVKLESSASATAEISS